MQSKTAKLIPAKNKIESVTVRRIVDESPDTSYYGEYSNKRTSEFSIDRAHSLDCASAVPGAKAAQTILEHAQQTVGDLHNAVLAQYNGTLANEVLDLERDALDEAYDLLGSLVDEVVECDCGERGDMGWHEFCYFNPSFNYVDASGKLVDGNTAEEVRKYVRQDYDRMESLNRGDWCYFGISAEAKIVAMVDGKEYSTTLHASCFGYESDMGHTDFESAEADQLWELRGQLKEYGFSARAIAAAFKNVEHKEE